MAPPPPASHRATEQEARDVAEASREQGWESPSFVRDLFEGNFRLGLVHPYPLPDAAEVERARPFMAQRAAFMRDEVDSDEIDREGKIPEENIARLREMGAFGIKIPEAYGGLGFNQLAYTHAIGLVTSLDGNPTALLSAHHRITAAAEDEVLGAQQRDREHE